MGTQDSRGRVERLEIENFKSYRGKGVIGPFKHFTTIIGPNGSGKSNLMDAISFVLGVKTGVLRGSNLRELLYVNTDSQDAEDHPDRGHVTLVFETPDGDEIHFTRAIHPTNGGESHVSQYRLDGRVVTAEAYNAKLESFGILVRARNFLVFQGDIENVAQMSPKDLTNLVETISGSAGLRKEYDEAETRAKDAESSVSVVFSKRKAIAVEKRQKKEQKAEAEKHIGLVAELEEMKVRHALWQVYHIHEDMKGVREDGQRLEQAAESAEAAAAEAEAAAEAHRRQQAGVAKDRLLLEKQIKKKKAEAEKKNPGLIKVREQIAHNLRRAKTAGKQEEAARGKAAEHAARVASLKEQLEQLQDAQRQVESELEDGRKGRMNLSPDLLDEYNTIKRELGAKTSKIEAECAALQAAADADAEALSMMKDSTAAVDERIKELETSFAADQARLETLTATQTKATTEREQHIAERERLRIERRRVESRRSQLERRIEDAEGTLRDAKADSKQSQREEAQRALVTHLRSTFPQGVYGMVSDLADPTADKYKLAMSVVMGKDFDSVVVDSPETAMQCIQMVKERRMPPMTFLPADTIRVKEVNSALRALGGSSRLAIDCLHVKDERAVRAFQSICGATLLCDGVQEAKQLAFNGETRHKVVALDGTAFLKTGLITGGITTSMEERARKWDQDRVNKLKEERARLMGELTSMPTLRELSEALQAEEAALSRLDNTLHYSAADAKSTADKVKEAKEQITALKRERKAKAPDVSKLEKQIADRERKVAALRARVDAVADQMFAGFSKKIGVSSIREYEGKHLKEAERLAERRVAVSAQVARVRNQLEYESAADPGAEADKLAAEVKALGAALESLKKEEAEFEAASSEVRKELEGLEARSAELKARLDELDAASKELKKKARTTADEVASHRRTISAMESKLEQLRAARADVLEAAELESLTLPVLTGRRAAAAKADDYDDDDVAEVEVDEEAGPSDAPTRKSTKKVYFDFSVLNDDDTRREAAARQRRETEMKASMEETGTQLARMAPNMKAVEQYQEVAEREKEQMEEVESARRECKTATDTFNSVRQRRFELFSAALTHITGAIDPIYKELTRSAVHPSGGQAYLSPENTEDPFTAGIKFSAMPPTKPFRDMEQLSGGEKTVAALALLFAVHSFHPSPFFVLDEIDAALDASNVAKVAAYMRAKTRPGAPGAFQGIVISLKDVFFEKADALVGVCRNPSHGCSETLTFDLERFGAPLGLAA